jgi:hypothetical protein
MYVCAYVCLYVRISVFMYVYMYYVNGQVSSIYEDKGKGDTWKILA